jgi:hypothetical protein
MNPAAPRSRAASVWRLLSWPLLLLPLVLGWYLGLAGLHERVEERRAVDVAAFESGFSPIRFDFSSPAQLIGAEVQGGRYTPAVLGTTVVEPARIDFEAAGVYFGLRFEGRTLDLGVFREVMLLADASCSASLRLLLDGDTGDAAWMSTPVELPTGATLGWGQGLPATLIDLDSLGWLPREQNDASPRSLSELPRLQRALRLYVEAAPGCVLRLGSLGFAAAESLDVRTVQTVRGWIGPGPARHAIEASWAAEPQRLLALEPALPGADALRAGSVYAGWAASLLAAVAVLLGFFRRLSSAGAALLGALVCLNLAPIGAPLTAPLVLIGLAAVLLAWESRESQRWRAPVWALSLPLAVALGLSIATGGGPDDDARYLGFALLQQGLLLLVLWPALAVLDTGTRTRLLAAGFALMHLPNFELMLLCLLGATVALTWYARRGDALSIVLAHALVGLWLGRSDGYGWLWGLETGWRWFG